MFQEKWVLDPFFPDLSASVKTASATVDEFIRASLFVAGKPEGIVSTRYQYQTWGGTRAPERRITGNLMVLRDFAAKDDYLLIERSTADPSFYRLCLIKQGTPEYSTLRALAAGRRWGPVDPKNPPVEEKSVEKALAERVAAESGPLALFDNNAVFAEVRTTKIARSRAFQQRVTGLYDRRCAVCAKGLVSPLGPFCEIEAAHIVPRGLKGADDARNGLALCRSHHWAFDRGLFGVDGNGEISVPGKVAAIAENSHLASFASKPIQPPSLVAFAPAPAALSWHMTNIVSLQL